MSDQGWRELNDARREDGEPVQGLLSDGSIVDAEWWGPVPDALCSPGEWDGSGWGWESSLERLTDHEDLIAWRPFARPRNEAAKVSATRFPGGNIKDIEGLRKVAEEAKVELPASLEAALVSLRGGGGSSVAGIASGAPSAALASETLQKSEGEP